MAANDVEKALVEAREVATVAGWPGVIVLGFAPGGVRIMWTDEQEPIAKGLGDLLKVADKLGQAPPSVNLVHRHVFSREAREQTSRVYLFDDDGGVMVKHNPRTVTAEDVEVSHTIIVQTRSAEGLTVVKNRDGETGPFFAVKLPSDVRTVVETWEGQARP